MPPHQGAVHPLRLVGAHLLDQQLIGPLGAGHHQQPRGAPVEPVHDPGPVGVADSGDVGIAGQQAVNQRAAVVPRTGVDNQAGGLVHHDEVQILKDRPENDIGVGRRLRIVPEVDVDGQRLALGDPPGARGDHCTVEAHAAGGHQPGCNGAAHIGHESHGAVKPQAVES